MMGIVQDSGIPGALDPRVARAPVILNPEVVNITISPGGAESLLREMAAANVRMRIREQVRSRQWDAAASSWRNLIEDYTDTQAAREMRDDPNWRLLQEWRPRIGRRI